MSLFPYNPISTPPPKPTPNTPMPSVTAALKGSPIDLSKMAADLKTRGWVCVRLDPQLVSLIDQSTEFADKFFAQSPEYKSRFKKEPMFGYFGVEHKESFRLLTGHRLGEHTFPPESDAVAKLTKVLDKVMHDLTLRLAPELFPNLQSDPRARRIPLTGSVMHKWGMFDITKYHNRNPRINCNPHSDPGLLSLSVRSTAPGLQLRDELGRWTDAPTDKMVGILWAGAMANKLNPLIKPGVHQVIGFPRARLALWYEVCVLKQEHTELIGDKKGVSSAFESKTGVPMSKYRGPNQMLL